MDNARVYEGEVVRGFCLLFIGGRGLSLVDLLRYSESNKSMLSVYWFCFLWVYVLRLYPLFLVLWFYSIL